MAPSTQPPLPSFQRGSGEPLVFLHGMALVPSTYLRTVELLADDVRVVAPMWLYVEGRWSEESITAALDATMDAVGIGTATVLGHSFGGGLALLFAARHPERIRRLVLVDALGASTRRAMARNALSGVSATRLASLMAARDFLGSVLTRPRDISRAAWWAYRRDMAAEVEAIARSDLETDVVWAAGDCLLSSEDGAELARRLKAHFTVVDDPAGRGRVDHDWPYRRPALFASTLRSLGILPPRERRRAAPA